VLSGGDQEPAGVVQVTAVVLVLMLGGATTLRDKLRQTKADTEQADVGAPAVTGAYRVLAPGTAPHLRSMRLPNRTPANPAGI
jgi:hypothetical protein